MRKPFFVVFVFAVSVAVMVMAGCGGGATTPIVPPPPPTGLTQNHFAFLRVTATPTAAQAQAVRTARAQHLAGAKALSKAGLAAVPMAVAAGPIDIFTMMNTGGPNSEAKFSTTSAYYFNVQLSANGAKAIYTAGVDTGAGAGYVQIFVVNTATKAVTQLTTDLEDHWDAQLSPDGTQVVFDANDENCGCYQIFTMSSSGGAETQLMPQEDSLPLAGLDVYFPTFGPGGTILFRDEYFGHLYVVNGDGSGLTQLTDGDDSSPSVSPDGTKVVFERGTIGENGYEWSIWIMDIDGQNPELMVEDGWDPLFVNNKIVFMGDLDGEGDDDIYAMNADGTGLVELVDTDTEEVFYWYLY